MSGIEEEVEAPTLSPVQLWRKDSLTKIGMPEWQAEFLALAGYHEAHEAERLIRRGCPPSLAFDIAR